MLDWKVGDKVECINLFKNPKDSYNEIDPIIGQIYTIRGFESGLRLVGIYLEEIINEPHQYRKWFGECVFDTNGFRKVIERGTETGMEILRKLQDPTKPVKWEKEVEGPRKEPVHT